MLKIESLAQFLSCPRVYFNKFARDCPKAAHTYHQQNGTDFNITKSVKFFLNLLFFFYFQRKHATYVHVKLNYSQIR